VEGLVVAIVVMFCFWFVFSIFSMLIEDAMHPSEQEAEIDTSERSGEEPSPVEPPKPCVYATAPVFHSRTAEQQEARLLDLDVIDGIDYVLRNDKPKEQNA
jgi:hypothetical protein